MTLVLCRIDDRLIHGQVVVGWGRPLGVERIVLVDEEVAANDWEQDLFRMAVPREIEVVFAGVAGAAARLAEWAGSPRPTMLLTGDIATMAALHAADGAAVRRINLGGIHHQPGRTERLPYVYLTDDEFHALERLEAAGAQVSAQDVPTAPRVGLRALG